MNKVCSYQGHEFGAHYLDSVCISGYLWDADSGDADCLTIGGEIPCPECNHKEWLQYDKDGVMEKGWIAAEDGEPRTGNYFKTAELRYEKDRRTLVRWWNQGYDSHGQEKPK